ncbi:DUF2062 domain-containing protein [Pseudomonas sp. LS44]|uniref:DUF2062 domain-containing protein n=1 Tax=Pseudomonas sp. LS44 TaxID=1357074 RepID=UPI00215B1FBE|nr:DUF2062 domain-containing protein [Pseudomonas sp. LS44]UVE19227.1 DUF2062 domain-containing protein [Pseudomonas sp. LS44]
MPRRLFKRYMPNPQSIREHKSLRFLGSLMHDPNLWHLNRHSVSRAMAVGLFAAFIPIPMQMLLAATLALPVRGNLPISVGLVWLTNPITMPPVFYCTYKLGAWVMQVPAGQISTQVWPRISRFFDEPSWELIQLMWKPILQPFLVGSIVCGLLAALVGYVLTMLYWRWWVQRSWDKRRKARRLGAE